MTRARNTAVAVLVVVLVLPLLWAGVAGAQTLQPPVVTRQGDTAFTALMRFTLVGAVQPNDSTRVKAIECVQVRRNGKNFPERCRQKTGPWVRYTGPVAPPPPPSTVSRVEINPKTVTLVTGGAWSFFAYAHWMTGTTADSSLTSGFTFTATGGTLSPGSSNAVLYTAGSATGTYRVIARHSTGKADTATVTLTPGTPPPPPPPPTLSSVMLSPPSAALLTGAQQQFAVTGQYSDGSSKALVAAWNASGGTINTGGLYTAGATAGVFQVIGSDPGTGKADTSVVTLTAPQPPPPPGPYTPIVARDWKTFADKAALFGLFGVEGQMHNCATTTAANKYLCDPHLPVTDFYDLVPDPIFGKVVRYNGGPQLNTVLTTRPGRVAVHGVGVGSLTNVWVRQFVRFSPNYTTASQTGGQGSASHKLLFLRFPGSARAAVIIEGVRSWTIEHGAGTASPHPATNVLGTNAKCGVTGWPGGADIASYDPMFRMDARANLCPALPAGNGEWYEVILHHQQTDSLHASWVTAWRQVSAGGQRMATPGPWRINGRNDVTTGTWRFSPIYRYEMGVNRNRQWDEPMFIDWGPYEVVDGSKYPNPFNAPWS